MARIGDWKASDKVVSKVRENGALEYYDFTELSRIREQQAKLFEVPVQAGVKRIGELQEPTVEMLEAPMLGGVHAYRVTHFNARGWDQITTTWDYNFANQVARVAIQFKLFGEWRQRSTKVVPPIHPDMRLDIDFQFDPDNPAVDHKHRVIVNFPAMLDSSAVTDIAVLDDREGKFWVSSGATLVKRVELIRLDVKTGCFVIDIAVPADAGIARSALTVDAGTIDLTDPNTPNRTSSPFRATTSSGGVILSPICATAISGEALGKPTPFVNVFNEAGKSLKAVIDEMDKAALKLKADVGISLQTMKQDFGRANRAQAALINSWLVKLTAGASNFKVYETVNDVPSTAKAAFVRVAEGVDIYTRRQSILTRIFPLSANVAIRDKILPDALALIKAISPNKAATDYTDVISSLIAQDKDTGVAMVAVEASIRTLVSRVTALDAKMAEVSVKKPCFTDECRAELAGIIKETVRFVDTKALTPVSGVVITATTMDTPHTGPVPDTEIFTVSSDVKLHTAAFTAVAGKKYRVTMYVEILPQGSSLSVEMKAHKDPMMAVTTMIAGYGWAVDGGSLNTVSMGGTGATIGGSTDRFITVIMEGICPEGNDRIRADLFVSNAATPVDFKKPKVEVFA